MPYIINSVYTVSTFIKINFFRQTLNFLLQLFPFLPNLHQFSIKAQPSHLRLSANRLPSLFSVPFPLLLSISPVLQSDWIPYFSLGWSLYFFSLCICWWFVLFSHLDQSFPFARFHPNPILSPEEINIFPQKKANS